MNKELENKLRNREKLSLEEWKEIYIIWKKYFRSGQDKGYIDWLDSFRKPILTTTDGVEIYDENAFVSYVWTNSVGHFTWGSCYPKNLPSNTHAIFSTTPIAQQYVEKNKPKFSEKEIEGLFEKQNLTFINSFDLFYDIKTKADKLIESKK